MGWLKGKEATQTNAFNGASKFMQEVFLPAGLIILSGINASSHRRETLHYFWEQGAIMNDT